MSTTSTASITEPKPVTVQLKQGLKIAFRYSVPHIRDKFVILPLTLMAMIVPLYGINKLFKAVAHVNIPSSVTGLLILFFSLMLCELVFGTKKAKRVLHYVDIPCGWSLRWINIFFTPSFTLLPLASKVSVAEAFEIAGVFVIGFFFMFVGSIYFVYALQKVTGVARKSHHDRDMSTDSSPSVDEAIQLENAANFRAFAQRQADELQREFSNPLAATDETYANYQFHSHLHGSHDNHVPTASATAVPPSPPEPVRMPDHTVVSFKRDSQGRISGHISSDLDVVKYDVSNIVSEASSTTSTHTRASSHGQHGVDGTTTSDAAGPFASRSTQHVTEPVEPSNTSTVVGRRGSNESSTDSSAVLPEEEDVTDLSVRIASLVVLFFDWAVYLVLVLVGQVVYFTTGYSMPLHLGMMVLCYRSCLLIPALYRRVLHPIIVSGGLSMFFISVFALTYGQPPLDAFREYKTGRNYLTFFDHAEKGVHPGAGDVLSTLLDCSIVSLAVPMFQYRAELRRFFWILSIPSLFFGFVSFFAFPPIGYYCGIEATRALAFVSRSVTLGLALPITEDLQGSTATVSVIAVLSGITGVVIAYPLYNKPGLRVREDDYVTRGISMGINASAIGTAHLLNIDPRASALSSLTFFLYGIILVILSVIPPLVTVVRSWVGLGPVTTAA